VGPSAGAGRDERRYVYCKDPERTIAAFDYTIGAHNPNIEEPQDFSPARVNVFRREVARELDFSLSNLDSQHAWLAGLNGDGMRNATDMAT